MIKGDTFPYLATFWGDYSAGKGRYNLPRSTITDFFWLEMAANTQTLIRFKIDKANVVVMRYGIE